MQQLEPTALQVTVAHLFFKLKASHGYVVAGGAGLLASELISRPTHDLDLFTHAPVGSVKPARDTFIMATYRRGWQVTVLVDTATFCRMHIVDHDSDRDGEVLVDLAIDSPPSAPPTMTLLGPTLAPLELAGRKPRAARRQPGGPPALMDRKLANLAGSTRHVPDPPAKP